MTDEELSQLDREQVIIWAREMAARKVLSEACIERVSQNAHHNAVTRVLNLGDRSEVLKHDSAAKYQQDADQSELTPSFFFLLGKSLASLAEAQNTDERYARAIQVASLALCYSEDVLIASALANADRGGLAPRSGQPQRKAKWRIVRHADMPLPVGTVVRSRSNDYEVDGVVEETSRDFRSIKVRYQTEPSARYENAIDLLMEDTR